jgi:single-stranded DNA-binding protein
VTVISNTRWRDRQGTPQEWATAIAWTLWGELAVNAGQYLNVGSKVAVTGALESRRYPSAGRRAIFSFGFTARSVEFLESHTHAEARRNGRTNAPGSEPTNRPAEREA